MIRELITAFPAHLRTALEIGRAAELKPASRTIRNVLITGLGGSGIGGRIAAQIVADDYPWPISVNNNYFIPGWVGEDTLVIACSYSGNTEETLQAANAALEAGAEVACITTGGKIKAIADEKGLNQINVPGGMPPRQAFGYSFPQLFFILSHYAGTSRDFEGQVQAAIDYIEANQSTMEQEARDIAEQLEGTLPFIYTSAEFEGVGVRFRQQLNENSKMLACHQVFPEMNHNELVGMSRQYDNLSVVLFRNESDYSRTQTRMEICKGIFAGCTETVIDVWSKGSSDLERALYLIHFGDWITLLLAENGGIDPYAIEAIDFLKSELAKV